MVRIDPTGDGSEARDWSHNAGCGSATNSVGESRVCTLTTTNVGQGLGYAVYFNERGTPVSAPTPDRTSIENALLELINGATTSIDVALYGLDRQSIIDALTAAHGRGVTVRVVGDDEAATTYSAGYHMKHNRRCIMQKWEHLFLAPDGEKARYVNGQQLQNWKRINLYDYINQLGEEGWELVGYAFARYGGPFFAFKRPKPPSQVAT